jgi:hypothetical protein
MKIGVLIHRRSYYKVLPPFIEEFLRRGHSILCLHDLVWNVGTHREYDHPSLECVPHFRSGQPEVIGWTSIDELAECILKARLDAILFLNTHPYYPALRQRFPGKQGGLRWISWQNAADILAHPDELLHYDDVLVNSAQWADWTLERLSSVEDRRKLSQKIAIVGRPDLDGAADALAPDIRREWGIPPDRKVVLLLPFQFGSCADRLWAPHVYGAPHKLYAALVGLLAMRPRWVKQALRGQTDRELMRALRAFCDRENAWLLIKSRLKDPIKDYAVHLADKVLYDDDLYPSSMLKCLAVADLCVHFASTAVMETAFFGVPSLGIYPEMRDYVDFRQSAILAETKVLSDWPGVSQILTIRQTFEFLRQDRLDSCHVDPVSRQRYLERFVGSNDSSASRRAVDVIEQRIKVAAPC